MLSVSLLEWIQINRLFTKGKWIQDEVHSVWDLWTSNLQECKSDFYVESGMDIQHLPVGIKQKSYTMVGLSYDARSQAQPWHTHPPPPQSWGSCLGPAQLTWALAPTVASWQRKYIASRAGSTCFRGNRLLYIGVDKCALWGPQLDRNGWVSGPFHYGTGSQ